MRSHEAVLDAQETTMSEPVHDSVSVADSKDLRATLQDILQQLAGLSDRLAEMEKLVATAGAPLAPTANSGSVEARVPEPPLATTSVAAAAGISEEEFLAISAALAAWLGVQAHIRQIRLIHTGAWAQQGRATIQASHRLFL
jgi:methylmalonyl-CoA carboxyltransferase large subunit